MRKTKRLKRQRGRLIRMMWVAQDKSNRLKKVVEDLQLREPGTNIVKELLTVLRIALLSARLRVRRTRSEAHYNRLIKLETRLDAHQHDLFFKNN